MKKKIKFEYKDKVLQVNVIKTKLEDETEGSPVFSVKVLKGTLQKDEINDIMTEVHRQLKLK